MKTPMKPKPMDLLLNPELRPTSPTPEQPLLERKRTPGVLDDGDLGGLESTTAYEARVALTRAVPVREGPHGRFVYLHEVPQPYRAQLLEALRGQAVPDPWSCWAQDWLDWLEGRNRWGFRPSFDA